MRAHIAAGSFGDSSEPCLSEYATLLDKLAAGWASTKKFSAYAGPWPCGQRPTVGNADDGLLGKSCPDGVWSYANAGQPRCAKTASAARSGGPTNRGAAASGPNFEQTASWLADNLPLLAHATRSDGMRTEWRDFSVTKCAVQITRIESTATASYATVFTVPFGRVDRVDVKTSASTKTSTGDVISVPFLLDVAMKVPGTVHLTSNGPLGMRDANDLSVFVDTEQSASRIANALRRLVTLCRGSEPF